MRKPLILLPLISVAISFGLAAKVTQSIPTMVGTAGEQTRMLIAGDHGPVVILDTFGEMPLEFWGTIQTRCAEFGRVVTYDHRGTGGSDPGPKPRDAQHIATELHTALHAAKLQPPYVLVGYSFGGPYTRLFADLYPDEVSGMVLIDPSQEEFFDWLKKTRPDLNKITPEDEAGQGEFACTYISLGQVRAAKIPDVPLTLITAMRSFGEGDHRIRPHWLEAHKHWVSQIPRAKHIVTERSDHGIIWEEPDLVVGTIRDVVGESRMPAKIAGNVKIP